jgi:hypothetical protein
MYSDFFKVCLFRSQFRVLGNGYGYDFFMPVFILPVDIKSNMYSYPRVETGIHIRIHQVEYPRVHG